MNSLMISKTKIESHSLKITNDILSRPKFYNLLNNWILDMSNGTIKLDNYYSYQGFCAYFSVGTTNIIQVIKRIQKPTPDGCVIVTIYRASDYIKVVVNIHTEELEIIEKK